MNSDLENTLAALGPGYREMVLRMKAPFEPRRNCVRFAAYLVAASLALAFVLASLFSPPTASSGAKRKPAIYTAAYRGDAAAHELVATQNADGSWENDFITRQNAAALRNVAGASVAYRKAVRYLRSRGLAALTDDELRSRAAFAASRQLASAM